MRSLIEGQDAISTVALAYVELRAAVATALREGRIPTDMR